MAVTRRTRASVSDRDRAIELLRAAYADGQLTSQELDRRCDAALAAATLHDLDRLVSDLRVEDAEAAPRRPQPAVSPPERQDVARAAVFLAVVAGVAVAGAAGASGEYGGSVEPLPVASAYDPLTAEGYTRFVAQVGERVGTTVVGNARIGEHYAVVEVPVPGGSGDRLITYTWRDGEFTSGEQPGSSMDVRTTIDLAAVRPEAVQRLADRVERMVEEAESSTVEIGQTVFTMHSDLPDDYCFTASASNRFSERAEVLATCGGEVIDSSVG